MLNLFVQRFPRLRYGLVLGFLGLTSQLSVAQNTPTARYNTVAEMLAARIPASANTRISALVTGRLTDNDGGGGTFFYDPASNLATNLGTIFKPNSNNGRWIREYSGVLNVRWFGAVGDGSDDIIPINSAIDMASVAEGIVQVPDGTYSISTNITIKSNVTLVGNGYNSVIKMVGIGFRVLQNENRSGPSVVDSDITISNLRFDGNKSIQSSEQMHCLDLRYIKNITVTRVWLTNAKGDGCYLRGNQNAVLDNIVVSDTDRQGISLTLGDQTSIKNVSGDAFNAVGSLIDLEPNPGDVITGTSLENIQIISGTARTLNIFGEDPDQILDLSVKDVITSFLHVNGVTRGVFDNIRVNHGGTNVNALIIGECTGVYVNGLFMPVAGVERTKVSISACNDVKVEDAVIVGPGGNTQVGVDIVNCNRITLSKITLTDGGIYGIRHRNSVEAVFNECYVSGSGTYGFMFSPTTSNSGVKVVRANILNYPTGIRLEGTNGIIYLNGNASSLTMPVSIGGTFNGVVQADMLEGYTSRNFVGSAVPVSGTWSRGNIVWYRQPVSNGYVGAVCVSGGTPGTWQEFGLIGNVVFPVNIGAACSDETTPITVGTNKITFRVPSSFTLTGVRASLTTAQASGSTFTVDINQNGTSVLSTKLTIDNGATTSTTATIPPVISTSAITDDSQITVDVDQIGNGTATGLKIWLIGTR